MNIEEFRFHHREILALLLLAPFMLWLARYWSRTHQEKLEKFSLRIARKVQLASRIGIAAFTIVLSMSLIVLALARPQGNPEQEEREAESLNIMVLLDVSRSMDATDTYPSRLEKAKRSISSFLGQLAGDRVGVVAFASTAVLVSPLTNDYEVVRAFLTALSSDTIPTQGTDIGGAIKTALAAFQRASGQKEFRSDLSHAIVIFSDGELTSGEVEEGIREAEKAGVPIYSIMIGETKGAPIPVRDREGNLGGFKRDERGNTILSAANPDSLQEIAKKTKGQFFVNSVDDTELKEILAAFRELNRSPTAIQMMKIYSEFFMYPLYLALALLSFAYGGSLLRYSLQRILRIAPLFPLIFVLPQATKAQENKATTDSAATSKPSAEPSILEQAINFFGDRSRRQSGSAQRSFLAGKAGEASKILQELQVDNPESRELAYNLGTSLIKEGKTAEGRKLLEAAAGQKSPMTLDSLGAAARFNNAGSLAEAKEHEAALREYIALVADLSAKEKRSDAEEQILNLARKNIPHLIQKQQEKKSQQEKNQEDPENKKEEDKSGSQSPKESESKNDDKQDSKGQDGEQKKDGKTEEENKEDSKPKDVKFSDRKQFKDNESLSEQDAKKIMEALLQQEKHLQRKFLRQRAGDRQSQPAGGKDW